MRTFTGFVCAQRLHVKLDIRAANRRIGLGENGDEGITFSNRVADGATITYSDLKIAEGESEQVNIKSATFHCAGLAGETPSFSRVDLKGLSIQDNKEKLTIDSVMMADSNGSMASLFSDGLPDIENFKFEDGFVVPAVIASGFNMEAEGGQIKIKSFAMGHKQNDGERKIGDFMIADLDFVISESGS